MRVKTLSATSLPVSTWTARKTELIPLLPGLDDAIAADPLVGVRNHAPLDSTKLTHPSRLRLGVGFAKSQTLSENLVELEKEHPHSTPSH